MIEKTGSLASTGIPSTVSGNTFNLANEMTAFNGTPLTYDLNGNLLNDGTNAYTWDARNHLSTLTGSGTVATSASFIYDALSRRFEKTINQQTTAFLYDGLNPVQELTPSGLGQFAPTATMLAGLGIDEFFQRSDANGAQSFITDTLGSTLALTNAAGSISTSYTYEPFGNVSISPSATNTNPYQFTGRENDDTGAFYYRTRYYQPVISRFVSQDRLDYHATDLNLYGYVLEDPVLYKDPLGQDLNGWSRFPDSYEHYSRNRHNHCPLKEPKDGECGFKKDDYPWQGNGPLSLDKPKYRNSLGDECGYDDNGDLLPDDNGNYTYNYSNGLLGHMWQDVLPDYFYGHHNYIPGLTKSACGCQ